MTRMGIGAACLLALLLSGCSVNIPYRKVSETYKIDAANGHMLRTTEWVYRDGVTETTVDDVNATGNDVRRAEPPERTLDIDLF